MAIIKNQIQPIPVKDDIVGDKKHLNQPWELWFRKLYDLVSKSSMNRVENGISSTLSGNRLFFNYTGMGNVSINLQYPILCKTVYSWGVLNIGDKKITIPTFEVETNINEWVFLDVN